MGSKSDDQVLQKFYSQGAKNPLGKGYREGKQGVQAPGEKGKAIGMLISTLMSQSKPVEYARVDMSPNPKVAGIAAKKLGPESPPSLMSTSQTDYGDWYKVAKEFWNESREAGTGRTLAKIGMDQAKERERQGQIADAYTFKPERDIPDFNKQPEPSWSGIIPTPEEYNRWSWYMTPDDELNPLDQVYYTFGGQYQ